MKNEEITLFVLVDFSFSCKSFTHTVLPVILFFLFFPSNFCVITVCGPEIWNKYIFGCLKRVGGLIRKNERQMKDDEKTEIRKNEGKQVKKETKLRTKVETRKNEWKIMIKEKDVRGGRKIMIFLLPVRTPFFSLFLLFYSVLFSSSSFFLWKICAETFNTPLWLFWDYLEALLTVFKTINKIHIWHTVFSYSVCLRSVNASPYLTAFNIFWASNDTCSKTPAKCKWDRNWAIPTTVFYLEYFILISFVCLPTNCLSTNLLRCLLEFYFWCSYQKKSFVQLDTSLS